MENYLIKTDYERIVNFLSDLLFNYKFNCVQLSKKINKRMCPCISECYLKQIGEELIKLNNTSFIKGKKEDLDSLTCNKANDLIKFDSCEKCVIIQEAFDNDEFELLLFFCISIERYGIHNDSEKVELLKKFTEFLTKKKTYIEVKTLIGDNIKTTFNDLPTNCNLETRKETVIKVLYNFCEKYQEGNNDKKYLNFFKTLMEVLIRLEINEDNPSNDQTVLYRIIDKILIDICDETNKTT